MKKILITSDFLTSNNQGLVNRVFDFLIELFNNTEVCVSFKNETELFAERKRFYDLNQINFESSDKYTFENITPNNTSINCVASLFSSYDLVVFYELSDFTRSIVERLEIKFIDLWLSPIRFIEDLKFCAFSNDFDMHETIKRYQINDKKAFDKSKDIIEYFSAENAETSSIHNNSMLLVSQLRLDKSVFYENRFLTLLDYKSEISELSKKYDQVLLLKHPYNSEEEFNNVVQEFSKIENLSVTKENAYKLLSNKNIKHVVAISSSILEEALFFGKKISYLFKPVIPKQYITLDDQIFTLDFWHDLLNIDSSISRKILIHDNFLRSQYGRSWGYDIFLNKQFSNIAYNKVVDFCLSLESLDTNKSYIIYGLGSIAKFIIKYKIVRVISIVDVNNASLEYSGIPIVRISQIEDNSNVIITPFYDNKKILNELKSKNLNLILLN